MIKDNGIPVEFLSNGANGIFESMRAYKGRLFKLDEHLDRLFASAKSIGLRMPYGNKRLGDLIKEKLNSSGVKDAYIRVSIGTGVEIVMKKFVPYPLEYYEKGVKIMTSAVRRDSSKGILPSVKSSNFLWGVLAKIEGMNQEPFEVLMLNHEGYLTEGSVSNVFIVRDGVVMTPPAYSGLLKGITRGVVMNIAQECGLEVLQIPITRHDVYNANEVFLTNTSIEVMPVVSVDKRVIGNGTPGSITKKLLDEFRKVTAKRRSMDEG